MTTWITPDWNFPNISAFSTTETDPEKLIDYGIPTSIHWLKQVHGDHVHCVMNTPEFVTADASITTLPQEVLAIRTADCLPILIYAPHENKIAAIHAGWRGLLAGIISKTLAQFEKHDLTAWIGAHICSRHYEVDHSLFQLFTEKNSSFSSAFYPSSKTGHYLLDLKQIAKKELLASSVSHIVDANVCTFERKDLFSYRRDQTNVDRITTFIWIN